MNRPLGSIGGGKYYNLRADKVCPWPVAPLGEANTVIIGSSALVPLAKGTLQMLIILLLFIIKSYRKV